MGFCNVSVFKVSGYKILDDVKKRPEEKYLPVA